MLIPALLNVLGGERASAQSLAPDGVVVPGDSAMHTPRPWGLPFDLVLGESNGKGAHFLFKVPGDLTRPVTRFAFRRANYPVGGRQVTMPAFSITLEVLMGHTSVAPEDMSFSQVRNRGAVQRVVAPRRFNFSAEPWRADGQYGWVYEVVLDSPFRFTPGATGVIEMHMSQSTVRFADASGILFDGFVATDAANGSGSIGQVLHGSACGCLSAPSFTEMQLRVATRPMPGVSGAVILFGPHCFSATSFSELFFAGTSSSVFGGTNLPIDLTALGAPGCNVWTSWDVPVSANTTFRASGGITAVVDFTPPANPVVLGRSLFFQGVFLDRTQNRLGALFSNGLEVVVQPKLRSEFANGYWTEPINTMGPDRYLGVLRGGPRIRLGTR